jgi:hypothetical protein
MDGEFASHAMFGQMSKTERMRYAYFHLDHHLRGGGSGRTRYPLKKNQEDTGPAAPLEGKKELPVAMKQTLKFALIWIRMGIYKKKHLAIRMFLGFDPYF